MQNKSRSNLADAAQAFKSHVQEIEELARHMKTQHPHLFTQDLFTQDLFTQDLLTQGNGGEVLNVKDGNTLATIINHVGQPLTTLQQKKYRIYEQDTQANNSQIAPLVKNIMIVLNTL